MMRHSCRSVDGAVSQVNPVDDRRGGCTAAWFKSGSANFPDIIIVSLVVCGHFETLFVKFTACNCSCVIWLTRRKSTQSLDCWHKLLTLTHQPADLLLPVGGRASCGFDHGGGLIICQLLDASLTSYNVTHLQQDQKGKSLNYFFQKWFFFFFFHFLTSKKNVLDILQQLCFLFVQLIHRHTWELPSGWDTADFIPRSCV